MKFELGEVTPAQIDELGRAVQGSSQTLVNTSTATTMRISLLQTSIVKSMEITVTGTNLTAFSGTVTGMSLTLITGTGQRVLYFSVSEAQIQTTTLSSMAMGAALGSAASDMLRGIGPSSSFLSQYLMGTDTLIGNSWANKLGGGAGNDKLTGAGGADVIDGGAGTDTSVYRELPRSDYLVSRHSDGTVTVATRDGTTDRNTNVENLEFSSGTIPTSTIAYQPGYTAVPAGSVQTVYRFYNDRDKAFFYTRDAAERDMIIRESTDPNHTPDNGVWPYFYQGATFEEAHSSEGAVPVYRFYNTKTGHHFFTTSAVERDMVQRESTDPSYGQPGPLWTFVYEGEAFRAFTDPNHPDATAVYRFYSPSQDRHFFTASADEAAQVRLTGLWTDEGVGYWGEQTG
jgi:hypothetical protein